MFKDNWTYLLVWVSLVKLHNLLQSLRWFSIISELSLDNLTISSLIVYKSLRLFFINDNRTMSTIYIYMYIYIHTYLYINQRITKSLFVQSLYSTIPIYQRYRWTNRTKRRSVPPRIGLEFTLTTSGVKASHVGHQSSDKFIIISGI